MFFKRSGIPEESELVICTVKKILYHSVFVTIDEYQNLEGMIHISEVAPGRIRNLRDYVREGKQVVCKILKIDRQKGHIDLSLRRVNPSARSKKLDEFKQEEKAEKLLEIAAKKVGIDLAGIYKSAGEKIVEEYGLLTPCFYDILMNGESPLKEIKIPDNIAQAITEVVKDKMSLPEVSVSGYLKLQSFASDGVEVIKSVLEKALKLADKNKMNVDLVYIGAPRYQLTVRATDYKIAESNMEKLVEFIEEGMESVDGTFEFSEKK